jgi:serine/threonine-protein kinase OSR1/STK39
MRKIKFEEPPTLKNPENFDPSFHEFIKSCLIKDPKLRPTAEEILKNNKNFFSFAKDKDYLREHLLKGIPTLEKRVITSLNYSLAGLI